MRTNIYRVISHCPLNAIAETQRTTRKGDLDCTGGAWRDVSLRRAVANCRRALRGETPLNLIGADERML